MGNEPLRDSLSMAKWDYRRIATSCDSKKQGARKEGWLYSAP